MPDKKHTEIKLKRAYDAPVKADGGRILVDRVWPRGVSDNELPLDDRVVELAWRRRPAFSHRTSFSTTAWSGVAKIATHSSRKGDEKCSQQM